MASRKTTTVLPKYKQLEKRIKELREDRRELEHTIAHKQHFLGADIEEMRQLGVEVFY